MTEQEARIRAPKMVRRGRRVSMGMIVSLSSGVAAVGMPAVTAHASPAAHPAAASTVTRLAGATRFATAIAASQDQFTAAGSAKAVVLTRGDTYPDALAGGPLAAKVGGPLLLTPPTVLDPGVQAEIVRVLPAGGTVYVLGGAVAISASVEAAITKLGFVVKRIFGATRFATAVAVADVMGDPTTVFEATGLNYADALAGGPAAIKSGGVILLTNGSTQAPETAAYLAAHPGGTHYALGGPAVAADKSATAIAGADRYKTAADIASKFFDTEQEVGIATGTNFPDALAAGPDLGAKGAPLLLVAPIGPVAEAPTAVLLRLSATVRGAVVFGGTSSVGDDVAGQVGALAGSGAVAIAADASPSFTGQYGVLAETITTKGSVAPLTQVFDGTAGSVTVYARSVAPVTDTSPALAQLNALPLDAASMETAVNTLFASYDMSIGLTITDPKSLFFLNSAQILLDPVTPPTLRLAAYAAIATLPESEVASEVKDSMGRVGVEIFANSGTAGDSDEISYIFDPATGLPLENTVFGSNGSVVARTTVTSLSTTNTLPTDPYTS